MFSKLAIHRIRQERFILLFPNIVSFLFVILSVCISILLFLFSYLWVDYGLVLMLAHSHPIINNFHSIIDFGNGNREVLAKAHLLLIVALFSLQIALLFPKLLRRFNIKYLFLTASITTPFFSFAYPFLSHDIFTYLFSAKTLWTYHANPYTVVPEKFMATDLWVSFMRNIEFTYAYGPVSLLYSLIPMIIFSGKRFILNFYGLKLMNAFVFYFTGLLLFKLADKDKRIFSLWFFNPLLVIELLVNSHNDLLMIGLFVTSIFYLHKRSRIKSWLASGASVLTKYVSIIALPIMFLAKKRRFFFFRLLSIGLLLFLQMQTGRGQQAWYFTWVYMFLPFSKIKNGSWVAVYLFGVLLLTGYYPFMRSGFWGGPPLIPCTKVLYYLLIASIVFIELNLWNALNRSKYVKKFFEK